MPTFGNLLRALAFALPAGSSIGNSSVFRKKCDVQNGAGRHYKWAVCNNSNAVRSGDRDDFCKVAFAVP